MLLSEAWLDEFQLCIIRKHINHTSWNIYDNSHTPHKLLAALHCFRALFFSGMHCKGVSKQRCVYHLYRNVFLAQTRIRSHFGLVILFPKSIEIRFNTHYQNAYANACRNAFLELLRLSSIYQYREYESRGRLCHCGAALRNFIRKHNAFT